jgi:hypothetical protein
MANLQQTMVGIASASHQSNLVPAWKLEAKRKERAERIRRAVGTIAAGAHDQEASVS